MSSRNYFGTGLYPYTPEDEKNVYDNLGWDNAALCPSEDNRTCFQNEEGLHVEDEETFRTKENIYRSGEDAVLVLQDLTTESVHETLY